MKLGITIRNWGPTATPDFLTESAQLADRSTLDAIWINDHLGFPPIMDENLPHSARDGGNFRPARVCQFPGRVYL